MHEERMDIAYETFQQELSKRRADAFLTALGAAVAGAIDGDEAKAYRRLQDILVKLNLDIELWIEKIKKVVREKP